MKSNVFAIWELLSPLMAAVSPMLKQELPRQQSLTYSAMTENLPIIPKQTLQYKCEGNFILWLGNHFCQIYRRIDETSVIKVLSI